MHLYEYLLLELFSLLALLGGVLLGVVFGVIPGFTTILGVSICLPLTLMMQPLEGILFLLGIYKGGTYGGSISAILINTPGTPAASCTAIDGYQLAQKGKARQALEIALYASCAADVLSNIALIMSAVWLASIAKEFGPPELFVILCLALTTTIALSGASKMKGMVSLACGMLAATVGQDIIYGSDRFTFGSTELSGGLPFLPVLVGLFVVPQIFESLYSNFNVFYRPLIKKRNEFNQPPLYLKNAIKYYITVLRGSLIGIVLGALPGVGASIAAFASYGMAKERSKEKGEFGSGSLEGVAAAEAGNSAVTGATLVPLLALGIPGDAATAVILAAFMLHGLSPGPLFFEEQRDLIISLFIGLMFSSFFLLLVGRIAIRYISPIAMLPNTIIVPCAFAISVFGIYSIGQSTFDLSVMVAIGLLGTIFSFNNIPPTPFLLGFILSVPMENAFSQSMLIGSGNISVFFRSYGVLVVASICLVSLIYFLIRKIFKKNDRY